MGKWIKRLLLLLVLVVCLPLVAAPSSAPMERSIIHLILVSLDESRWVRR